VNRWTSSLSRVVLVLVLLLVLETRRKTEDEDEDEDEDEKEAANRFLKHAIRPFQPANPKL